jgi:TRAP transporter TAXI family solute receptor
MSMRAAAGCIVVALLAGSCSAPAAAPNVARPTIRFASGGPNGPFRAPGQALVTAYQKQLPEFDARVVLTQGSLDDVMALQRGEAEVAFSYADLAYAGFVGKLRDRTPPDEGLRGIALLQRAAVHVVAGHAASVHHIGDLRGRKADLGGAAMLAARSVLTAFQLKPDAIQIAPRPADSVAALLHGDVDTIFLLGVPPIAAARTALAGGAHLIPVDGAAVDDLLRQYPFYSAILLRPQMYAELPAPVATIGINGVLLCRADLDDDVVFRLTKALYEGTGGSVVDPALAPWLDLGVGAATPVPLHPGAARYYRERELTR